MAICSIDSIFYRQKNKKKNKLQGIPLRKKILAKIPKREQWDNSNTCTSKSKSMTRTWRQVIKAVYMYKGRTERNITDSRQIYAEIEKEKETDGWSTKRQANTKTSCLPWFCFSLATILWVLCGWRKSPPWFLRKSSSVRRILRCRPSPLSNFIEIKIFLS